MGWQRMRNNGIGRHDSSFADGHALHHNNIGAEPAMVANDDWCAPCIARLDDVVFAVVVADLNIPSNSNILTDLDPVRTGELKASVETPGFDMNLRAGKKLDIGTGTDGESPIDFKGGAVLNEQERFTFGKRVSFLAQHERATVDL